jgi:electron transfer flavoprotein beta subunit
VPSLDTWATSYALAQAIRTIGDVDLIFCGRQAIDGDTGQVGPGIAYRLGMTQLTYIIKIREIDPAGQRIVVERLLEEGREVVSGTLPALITVVKGINEPRYPTFLGIRRAARTGIPVWDASKVNADENKIGLKGSPTQVWKIFNPPRRGGQVQLMSGSTDEAAAALADKLLAEKVI